MNTTRAELRTLLTGRPELHDDSPACRARAGLRACAPLVLAMAVTAALVGCADPVGPDEFGDVGPVGVPLVDTQPAGGDTDLDAAGGLGADGEKW